MHDILALKQMEHGEEVVRQHIPADNPSLICFKEEFLHFETFVYFFHCDTIFSARDFIKARILYHQ